MSYRSNVLQLVESDLRGDLQKGTAGEAGEGRVPPEYRGAAGALGSCPDASDTTGSGQILAV